MLSIGNPRWPPPWRLSWKSILLFFSWTERPIYSKLGSKYLGNLQIKNSKFRYDQKSKIAQIVTIGYRKYRHLENLFCASSPGPKGQLTRSLVENIGQPSWKFELKAQLTRNLIGNIGATCRSKLTKIVPIGNPIWSPCPLSWKSVLLFSSWTKRPVNSKLVGSIGATCRSKIVSFQLEIQDGRQNCHLENLFCSSSN